MCVSCHVAHGHWTDDAALSGFVGGSCVRLLPISCQPLDLLGRHGGYQHGLPTPQRRKGGASVIVSFGFALVLRKSNNPDNKGNYREMLEVLAQKDPGQLDDVTVTNSEDDRPPEVARYAMPDNVMDRYDHLSTRCLQLVEVGMMAEDKFELALKLITEVERFLLNDNIRGDARPKILCETTTNEVNRDQLISQSNNSEGSNIFDPLQMAQGGQKPQKRKDDGPVDKHKKKAARKTSNAGAQNNVFPCAPSLAVFGTDVRKQTSTNQMVCFTSDRLAYLVLYRLPLSITFSSVGYLIIHILQDKVNAPAMPLGAFYDVQLNPHYFYGNQSGVRNSGFLPMPQVLFGFPDHVTELAPSLNTSVVMEAS
ncbi:hypothetical protein Taro_016806 [Colocasia esculenta]|uniref:Uncharacterized protein n=1 Tax=Colocasia esculenta TaxID=4460 RepID=A0A843UPS0_COLES|nr:hypothetical protein [Colocasia esculenta]